MLFRCKILIISPDYTQKVATFCGGLQDEGLYRTKTQLFCFLSTLVQKPKNDALGHLSRDLNFTTTSH